MACLEFYWEKFLRGLATHGHHVEHSKISNLSAFMLNNGKETEPRNIPLTEYRCKGWQKLDM